MHRHIGYTPYGVGRGYNAARYNDIESIRQAIITNNQSDLKKYLKGDLWCQGFWEVPEQAAPGLESRGMTALHLAAFYDSLECFVLLLEHPVIKSRRDFDTGFNYAAVHGSLEVATYIMINYPQNIKINENLIQLITNARQTKILEALFHYCGDKIAEERLDFSPCVTTAIQCCDTNLLKILLKNRHGRNRQNESLLISAVKVRSPEAVEMLLECGENPDHYNGEGKSALFYACDMAQERSVKALLSKMSIMDPPGRDRCDGTIHAVCQGHNVNIARMVLERGIDVNKLNRDGFDGAKCLVDRASSKEAIEIMTLMLKYGWKMNNEEAKANILALYMNGIAKDMEVIKWLIQNGADLGSTMTYTGKQVRVIDVFEDPRMRIRWSRIVRECKKEIEEFHKREEIDDYIAINQAKSVTKTQEVRQAAPQRGNSGVIVISD